MEQAISLATYDLKEFKRLANEASISYDIIEIKQMHRHKGVIKGELANLLRFARMCGIKGIHITIL